MVSTIIILSFCTDRYGQTVKTQIRLLLEEQSDQGLHCLLFHLNLFDEIPKDLNSFLEFKVDYSKFSDVPKLRNFTVYLLIELKVLGLIQFYTIRRRRDKVRI